MWLEGLESTCVSIDAPGELSFGRSGSLVVDPSNRQLHREVAVVRQRSGSWHLTVPDSTSHELDLLKPGARSPRKLHPDSATVLPVGVTTVRFVVAKTQYAVCIEVNGSNPQDLHRSARLDGLETVLPGDGVSPTSAQRRVLVEMCRPALGRAASAWNKVPSNRELATILGISAKTVEKHVAELYAQFAAAGVTALSSTDMSVDRRRLLVEHAMLAGVVTEADLELR